MYWIGVIRIFLHLHVDSLCPKFQWTLGIYETYYGFICSTYARDTVCIISFIIFQLIEMYLF